MSFFFAKIYIDKTIIVAYATEKYKNFY